MTALPDHTQAFRAYARFAGGLDHVQAGTGIGRRKLERMHAGTARVPPRLLRELAMNCSIGQTDLDLARELRDAADRLDAANPAHQEAIHA